MRIRMKTNYAGPARTCSAGDVIDLPQDEAYRVIEAGYGTQVDDGPAVERATAGAAENATAAANCRPAGATAPKKKA